MGLLRRMCDWLHPRGENSNESLRRGVREQVHTFRNHAMSESAQLRRAQDELSEVGRTTRRIIKRLELAKARLERTERNLNND